MKNEDQQVEIAQNQPTSSLSQNFLFSFSFFFFLSNSLPIPNKQNKKKKKNHRGTRHITAPPIFRKRNTKIKITTKIAIKNYRKNCNKIIIKKIAKENLLRKISLIKETVLSLSLHTFSYQKHREKKKWEPASEISYMYICICLYKHTYNTYQYHTHSLYFSL